MALVVLLRGVNVGGHRRFRPTQLARKLSPLDVVNIGAAGTFVVRAQGMTQAQLRREFERELPFETTIVICPGRDFVALVEQRPFQGEPARDDIVQFVSTLSRSPRSVPELPIILPADGPWSVRILASEKRFVIGVHRREMSAIGHLGEIDRLFGSVAATRGWNTTLSIARVLGAG